MFGFGLIQRASSTKDYLLVDNQPIVTNTSDKTENKTDKGEILSLVNNGDNAVVVAPLAETQQNSNKKKVKAENSSSTTPNNFVPEE